MFLIVIVKLRINKAVLEMFNDFAESNKQYSKVDLLSGAILNFINDHE